MIEKPNVVFLLLDALEYSTVENREVLRALAPTLSGLVDSGYVTRLHTNGMITQIAMPAIFSQTYPLDHDGYNAGIRNRPKSFLEIFKDAGYTTCLTVCDDTTGPRNGYGRGVDRKRELCDYTYIVNRFYARYFDHTVTLYETGEITREQCLSELQQELGSRLDYIASRENRVARLSPPYCLGVPSAGMAERCQVEKRRLMESPEQVMDFIRQVPPGLYSYLLGRPFFYHHSKILLLVVRAWTRFVALRAKCNAVFSHVTRAGVFIVPQYMAPIAREVFNVALDFIKSAQQPWFLYFQVLDVHDGRRSSRLFNFIGKLRFLPKALKLRRQNPTHRDFWRDVALMYVDNQLTRFMCTLEKLGQRDSTRIFVASDHGIGWDPARGPANSAEFGFRTHYEHMEVPFIVADTKRFPHADGLHDSMSISATVLEELGMESHPSFLGRAVAKSGKSVVVAENLGRGNCDWRRRDIHFTLRSKTHRMMVLLKEDKLIPVKLFDIQADSHECENVVDRLENQPIIDTFLRHLAFERSSLLEARGVEVSQFGSFSEY